MGAPQGLRSSLARSIGVKKLLEPQSPTPIHLHSPTLKAGEGRARQTSSGAPPRRVARSLARAGRVLSSARLFRRRAGSCARASQALSPALRSRDSFGRLRPEHRAGCRDRSDNEVAGADLYLQTLVHPEKGVEAQRSESGREPDRVCSRLLGCGNANRGLKGWKADTDWASGG